MDILLKNSKILIILTFQFPEILRKLHFNAESSQHFLENTKKFLTFMIYAVFQF